MKSTKLRSGVRRRTASRTKSRNAASTRTRASSLLETPTPERIQQIAWGYAPPLILEAALEHHVFDALEAGPRTVSELAAQTGASERGLRAILDALVGIELLQRKRERYKLTLESATFLVSTKPSYHGNFFRHAIRQLIPRWLDLPEIVRTGRPVAKREQHEVEEFFAEFVESLFPLSYKAAQVLGEHLGIAKVKGQVRVLDLGAGSGVWGIALAQQSPHVRIRAVDWPRVLEITKKVAQQHGVLNRLTVAPGDLLEADFGSGHQVATIGHILHSEGTERSRRLIKRTFDALASGGTIAISEFLPNEDRTGPPNALIFGVNMLIHTEGGDVFTFSEISKWLQDAGFVATRLLEAPAPSPLVLATKP